MSTQTKAREPIPVGVLKFQANAVVEVPGSHSSSVTHRKHRDSKSRYEIEFHPWLRAFRVAFFSDAKTSPTEVVYVPEGNVQLWYPLDTVPVKK